MDRNIEPAGAVAVAALDRFALLVRREFGLAPEFHAIGFRIGAAWRRALLDGVKTGV